MDLTVVSPFPTDFYHGTFSREGSTDEVDVGMMTSTYNGNDSTVKSLLKSEAEESLSIPYLVYP